jgi:hypothetical protein
MVQLCQKRGRLFEGGMFLSPGTRPEIEDRLTNSYCIFLLLSVFKDNIWYPFLVLKVHASVAEPENYVV